MNSDSLKIRKKFELKGGRTITKERERERERTELSRYDWKPRTSTRK